VVAEVVSVVVLAFVGHDRVGGGGGGDIGGGTGAACDGTMAVAASVVVVVMVVVMSLVVPVAVLAAAAAAAEAAAPVVVAVEYNLTRPAKPVGAALPPHRPARARPEPSPLAAPQHASTVSRAPLSPGLCVPIRP
jgi:hypothetical protein